MLTRKTVTILFMDAVGSTGIADRLDPETLRRVMSRYFDEISRAIEYHGGTLEKYIGDAVMAVFGVPTLHEDDALRAVRAAVDIRDRLAQVDSDLSTERGVTIGWRTGINSGEVIAGDAAGGQRFVSGDAVNVAARLEQAAQAGTILLGESTYRLVRGMVQAEPLAIDAKGKPGKLEAYRLVDLSPETAATARVSPMVGRRRQLRLLHQAFEDVVEDRVCHLFTILGPAGVGKSRLVNEFLQSLASEARVIRGRCLSYGEGITFWPVAEAIREAAGLHESDSPEEMRAGLAQLVESPAESAGVVEPLVGMLSGTGTATSEEIFRAVRLLLQGLARIKPLVLELDDIQWGEPTMLDLIEHLADWTRDAPLLVLCVARQDLLEVRPGWAGGKAHATTISLEPLNASETEQLIGNLSGNGLDMGLRQRILQVAEGNPLFVEEMLAMLLESDGRETAVPPTIHALLAARLDRLAPQERAVAERAAVEGKVFHRSAVAELAPEEMRPEVGQQLRSLSRKELITPDRSDFAGDEAFRFRHLLIRDAAYSALTKEERADLHARFADWLERAVGERLAEYEEILGYHLERAYRYRQELGLPGQEASALARRAAGYLGAAGQRALGRTDIHAALKLLRTTVELLPGDAPERRRYVADLGLAMSFAGELTQADEMLSREMDQAAAAGDTLGAAYAEVVRLDIDVALGRLSSGEAISRCEALAAVFDAAGDRWGAERATWELSRHHFFAGRASQAEHVLREQLAKYSPDERPPMPVLFGVLFASIYSGPRPISEALEQLGQLADRLSQGTQSVRLRTTAALLADLGRLDEARTMLERALAIEHDLGRTVMADTLVGDFIAPLEIQAGNFQRAEELLTETYRSMVARGDQGFSSTVAAYLAQLYVRLGRTDEAEQWAERAIATSTDDDVESRALGLACRARTLAQRGEFERAIEAGREAVAVADATDYMVRRGLTHADLAEVLHAAGRTGEAIAEQQRAIENFEQKGALFYLDAARRRMTELET